MNTKLNAQIDCKPPEALSSDFLPLAPESCFGRTLVCLRGIKTKTIPAPSLPQAGKVHHQALLAWN